MLSPILRWITSNRPSMCALLSLGTFFLFCSFESVLFWKYYKRDTSGATLCYVSNSNAVVSRHVEISKFGFFYHSLLFLKVWSWEILIYRAPAAKPCSQKTISWDYRYFRFAWCCKDSFFFLQNQFSVDRSRILQILTCNLQITPFVKKCGFKHGVSTPADRWGISFFLLQYQQWQQCFGSKPTNHERGLWYTNH